MWEKETRVTVTKTWMETSTKMIVISNSYGHRIYLTTDDITCILQHKKILREWYDGYKHRPCCIDAAMKTENSINNESSETEMRVYIAENS